jgi:Arm DNA-binding domain
MTLTDAAARNAKPREKPYKLSDGHGLYLQVEPSGSKLWRLKYRFNEREKRLSFGVYPSVTLAQARELQLEARRLLGTVSIQGNTRSRPGVQRRWPVRTRSRQ